MPDTLDTILFDLSEVLPERYHGELIEKIKTATHIATAEMILEMSFHSPDGGADFRRRVFETKTKAPRLTMAD